MLKKALTITAVLLLSACSQPEQSTKTLEGMGFTNVQTHGYAFWGCSQDDDFSTKFTATNTAGKQVSGVVCGGVLKGQTVRFD